MTTLWQALDAHLTAAGASIDGVRFAGVGDVADIDTAPLPAVLVMGNDAQLGAGSHGDGAVHREASYRYALLGFAEGAGFAAAKRAAQALVPSLEAIAYAPALAALAGDDGERVQLVEPGEATISLYLKQAGVNQKHIGVAAVTFTVEAAR